MSITLGSLFDGSGGFPLAGVIHGIAPVWASEIEPFPIRVTKLRFPGMKHLGSVTDINGAEIEPVDIITFGSPCQDLSVAGKQIGIHEGQRSNLFFEAIRIIKEMREHDRAIGRADIDLRPRFAVWENVPGAFSSNKGKDFQAVLQALCEVKGEAGLYVPEPKNGRWLHAGSIVGDDWSIAWRVYDAQFWGVPQRRKRIYLIADFGSERAGKILFERESLCRDSAEGREAWQGTAANAERSAGRNGGVGDVNPAAFMGGQGAKAGSIAYSDDGITPTLKSSPSGGNTVPDVVYPINTMVATRGGKDDMRTCFGIGEPNDPQFTISSAHEHAVCYGVDCRNLAVNEEKSGTIQAKNDGGHSLNFINPVCYSSGAYGAMKEGIGTIGTGTRATAEMVAVYPIDQHQQDARFKLLDKDSPVPTLSAKMGEGGNNTPMCLSVGNGQMHNISMKEQSNTLDTMHDQQIVMVKAKHPRKYIIRRLMPTECARLQGFPDWWTDGADGSDTAKYKMWGNGIALPCAADVLGRIAKEYDRNGRCNEVVD